MWSNPHAIDSIQYLYVAISSTLGQYHQWEDEEELNPTMDLPTHLGVPVVPVVQGHQAVQEAPTLHQDFLKEVMVL